MIRTLAVLVAALTIVSAAGATPPPAKILADYELRINLSANTRKSQVHSVVCAKTNVRRLYMCTYRGVLDGKKFCVKDYVHFVAGSSRPRIAYYRPAWDCSAMAPVASSLPVYPGDEPPAA